MVFFRLHCKKYKWSCNRWHRPFKEKAWVRVCFWRHCPEDGRDRLVPARWKIPPTSGTWASPEAWGSPAQGTGLTWHSQSKLEQLRKSPTNPLPQRSSAHLHLVESQLCFFLATACPSHQGQLWQQPQKKPSLCHRSLLATGLNGTGIRRIPSAVSGALAKRRKCLLEQCWTLQTPEKLPGSHAAESS